MTLLLFIVALLMETAGSYISVIGLSHLFGRDYIILFIACILDVAKVTSVSFLYQYWREMKTAMKAYLTVAVCVLMLITSVGAFGYLSGAFQKAVQPNEQAMLRLDSLKSEKAAVDSEKTQLLERKAQIEKQIAQLPPEYVTARQRLMTTFRPELKSIDSRLSIVTKRADELIKETLAAESENVDRDVHAGPITYVAKAFNVSMEQASKYIILTIIFVFDPLAVMLVIAGNFLIKRRQVYLPVQPVTIASGSASSERPAALSGEGLSPAAVEIKTSPAPGADPPEQRSDAVSESRDETQGEPVIPSLHLPAGWKLSGTLPWTEIEKASEEELDLFDEDVLTIIDPSDKYLLDVGWYPAADRGGKFNCRAFNNTGNALDWQNPLEAFPTRSVEEVKGWIARWVEAIQAAEAQQPAKRKVLVQVGNGLVQKP